jgi:ubiquinone/menaquinone biosynthesis C-methylase UbiE
MVGDRFVLRIVPRIPRRPAYTTEPEWMDAPGHPRALIDDNLDDLRRVNWLLGGVRLTLLPLRRLSRRVPPGERLRVLDLATGAADIPRAMARWARRAGRDVFVVASDVNLDVLQSGRDHEPVPAGIVFVVADATRLPFGGGSFHVATASLALHHLLPEQGVAMLREMGRCARVGVVVNDIVRTWLAYFGAIIATRVGSTNRLTLHDGPLSVRRAFTVTEMRRMARQAGLTPTEWDSFLFYRVAMSAQPSPSPTHPLHMTPCAGSG